MNMTVALDDAVAIHWGRVCDVLTVTQVTSRELALDVPVGRPC